MNFSVFSIAGQRWAAILSILMLASTLWGGEALETSMLLPNEPLPGNLVICGGGYFPEAVYEKFVDLAGGPHARLVIILTASEYAQSTFMEEYMQSLFRRFGVLDMQFLHTRSRQVADDPTFVEPLTKATGVWIGGGVQQRLTEAYLGTAVEKALHAVLARGGVIGGTSSGAAVMSRLMIVQGKTVAETGPGFGFLTGAVVDQHFLRRNRQERLMGVLANNPGLFGLGIDEGTAVIVEGRRMTVIGASQACICFAGCGGKEPRIQMLKNGEQADLVALSRAAIARMRAANLVAEEQPPQVAGGTLVMVGGGSTPEEAVERFIASAGGEDAPLVVVTTAQGDAPPPEQSALGWLRDAGAKRVTQIHARTRGEADDPKVLAALGGAKGVWFSGGRQWRLVDAFAYTKAYNLLKGVIEEGGVVGGSSAGAMIQGGLLVRGNPLGGDDLICEGYEEGFGFLPGVAIDQQFSQRNRFADMLSLKTSLKKSHPRLLGLGIDEATAVIVHGREMQVVGKNHVAVYDQTVDNPAEQLYQKLAPGDRYDLVARQRLGPALAESKATSSDEKMPGAVGQ